MTSVGQGVKEIRIRDSTGAFRVSDVAKFAEAVFVLHCFRKKTEQTGKTKIALETRRYRELLQESDR